MLSFLDVYRHFNIYILFHKINFEDQMAYFGRLPFKLLTCIHCSKSNACIPYLVNSCFTTRPVGPTQSTKAQTSCQCVLLFLPALQQLSFSSAPIFRKWHGPVCPVYCLLATQPLLPVPRVKAPTFKFHQWTFWKRLMKSIKQVLSNMKMSPEM